MTYPLCSTDDVLKQAYFNSNECSEVHLALLCMYINCSLEQSDKGIRDSTIRQIQVVVILDTIMTMLIVLALMLSKGAILIAILSFLMLAIYIPTQLLAEKIRLFTIYIITFCNDGEHIRYGNCISELKEYNVWDHFFLFFYMIKNKNDWPVMNGDYLQYKLSGRIANLSARKMKIVGTFNIKDIPVDKFSKKYIKYETGKC